MQKMLDSIPIISPVIDMIPNGLLSHPLFVKAIKTEHATRPLLFADKPLTVALAELSKAFRVCLSKWRDVRKGGEPRRIVFIAASKAEIDQITDVLYKIDLAWADLRYERGFKPGDLSPPKSWTEATANETALVPWQPPVNDQIEPQPEFDSSGLLVAPEFDMAELALGEDEEEPQIVAFAPPKHANKQLGNSYDDDLMAALHCGSATAKHNGIINNCKEYKRMMKECDMIEKEMARAPVVTPKGKKKETLVDSVKKTGKVKADAAAKQRLVKKTGKAKADAKAPEKKTGKVKADAEVPEKKTGKAKETLLTHKKVSVKKTGKAKETLLTPVKVSVKMPPVKKADKVGKGEYTDTVRYESDCGHVVEVSHYGYDDSVENVMSRAAHAARRVTQNAGLLGDDGLTFVTNCSAYVKAEYSGWIGEYIF